MSHSFLQFCACHFELTLLILSEFCQEILSGVRSFISRTSGRKYDVCNAELTKSSLFLLRNLPAARLAVLEHLHNVFDDAVNFYLARSETSYEGEVL